MYLLPLGGKEVPPTYGTESDVSARTITSASAGAAEVNKQYLQSYMYFIIAECGIPTSE